MNAYYDEFTEYSYREILELARVHRKPIFFTEYKSTGNNLLWRHDIDFSVHRALRLATIEGELGFPATYFVNLHSDFYNALEIEIIGKLREILALGHMIGLHFDTSVYSSEAMDLTSLEKFLAIEKDILGKITGAKITAFSFHNPSFNNSLTINNEEIAGMINSYSSYFRDNYFYISDSNGVWQNKDVKGVFADPKLPRVQVLTHPEWWTPTGMSPRMRVSRCIDGRAAAQHKHYDDFIQLASNKTPEQPGCKES